MAAEFICQMLHAFLVTLTFHMTTSEYREVFIECGKTKTKVITLTNHNSRKQSSKRIRALTNYTCSRRQGRENAYRQVAIGFGFTSD